MKIIIGVALGLLATYLIGAAVAWNFDPGQWNDVWRFWCICWAAVWAMVGGLIGDDIQRCRL